MATSQALLSKASGLLLLLCAGVCLPLRRAQQSGDAAYLVATLSAPARSSGRRKRQEEQEDEEESEWD